MALPAIHNYSEQTLTFVQKPVVITDYVFDVAFTLPKGRWEVTIEKGDAWVFKKHGNFTLHTNDSVNIEASVDGEIQIKRLYVRGLVKFHAKQLV